MKEKIKQSVKTYSSKYGLKDESREKIANLVEAKITARGEITPEQLDSIIEEELKSCEPFMALIQSEADSRAKRNTEPTPSPISEPKPQPQTSSIDVEALIKQIQEVNTQTLAAAIKPLQDKILAMENEKSRNSLFAEVKASFNEKYKDVRFSDMQKGFLKDAWQLASSSCNEQTTKDDLLKFYEDRFNKSCTLAGAAVIIPTGGQGGAGNDKTDYQKLVDASVPKDEDMSGYKSHFGIQ